MIFLWQIIYSVNRGGKGGIPINLAIVILVSRIPLAFRFLSENPIFREKYVPNTIMIIGCFQALHLIVIVLQYFLGGRFFILNEIIPDYYNYFHKRKTDNNLAKE